VHDLTPQQIRVLEYQYIVTNNKTVDPSWIKNKCAQEQWLTDFRKRCNNFS